MTPAAPPIGGLSPILITGGAGFIGANLADRLAREGEHVLLLDSLARPGVERNVAWLLARHPSKISLIAADVRDAQASADAAREASAIFHFAAQVAVTTSLVDPREDFSINAAGTLGLLESLRAGAPSTPLIFASTNKVYGDLANVPVELKDGAYRPVDELLARRGISENQPLDFHTPYGCSKGAAEQYVLDYARSYGLPTAVMRMSCIYGPRQMGTEDQGWVAHFLLKIAAGESAPFTATAIRCATSCSSTTPLAPMWKPGAGSGASLDAHSIWEADPPMPSRLETWSPAPKRSSIGR